MAHAPPLADLGQLSGADKDALIMALWTQLDAALAVNAELMASGQIVMRRVDGWQTLDQASVEQPLDLAA